jgi:hypothetical protein
MNTLSSVSKKSGAKQLRKFGWSMKVRADILGHSSVQTTEQVYDHADREDFRAALNEMGSQLLRDVTKSERATGCDIENKKVGAEGRT